MPLRGIAMSIQEPDSQLPRKPEDLSEIRRLRREALEHLDAEEHPSPSVVYGGPAFGGRMTRRWTLRRILLLIAALLAGLGATFFGLRRYRYPAPVYGGPPVPPQPNPDGSDDKKAAPVYGGPAPRPLPKPPVSPKKPTPASGNPPAPPNPAPKNPPPQPLPAQDPQ